MVIDSHMHVRGTPDGSLDVAYCEAIVEAGDLLGIELFCVSDLQLNGALCYADFHAANERVAEAIRRFPGRFLGYCFVNPGDPLWAREVDQRVRDEGCIGIKLYNQYRIDDPVVEPLLERCSRWQVPVLMHAGYATDPDTRRRQPRMSNAAHFVHAARRFPEAILIEGHIGGGGDWEWALKHLREAPSVFLDTSGSVVDEWMVDRCVEELGVARLLFATDMTMEGGVGKILDAHVSAGDRAAILGGNFEAILSRRAVA